MLGVFVLMHKWLHFLLLLNRFLKGWFSLMKMSAA